jgi:hypothetical protein
LERERPYQAIGFTIWTRAEVQCARRRLRKDGAARLAFIARADAVNDFIGYDQARRQDQLTPLPAALKSPPKARFTRIAICDFVEYVRVEVRHYR